MALRHSAASSWSTSSSSVLSDWTISGPSGNGGRLAPGPVGGHVGPRRAALRAVAPRAVRRGVDEDLLARGRVAHAEAPRAELAHHARERPEGLRDQQLRSGGATDHADP